MSREDKLKQLIADEIKGELFPTGLFQRVLHSLKAGSQVKVLRRMAEAEVYPEGKLPELDSAGVAALKSFEGALRGLGLWCKDARKVMLTPFATRKGIFEGKVSGADLEDVKGIDVGERRTKFMHTFGVAATGVFIPSSNPHPHPYKNGILGSGKDVPLIIRFSVVNGKKEGDSAAIAAPGIGVKFFQDFGSSFDIAALPKDSSAFKPKHDENINISTTPLQHFLSSLAPLSLFGIWRPSIFQIGVLARRLPAFLFITFLGKTVKPV